MQLFGYFLFLLCVSPLSGQFWACLPKHFNCIIAKVSQRFCDHVNWVTESTEHVYYDEERQMVVRNETGTTNGKPFWDLRIYDYPNEVLYYVTRPGGEEICTKITLTDPFKQVCLPNITQEIWLKSPLGSEGNMVPTVRFKWETGNVTTELTYTYFRMPVIQNWYGVRDELVLGSVPIFATAWYENITVSDVGPEIFTPPKSCSSDVINDDIIKVASIPFTHQDGYLSF